MKKSGNSSRGRSQGVPKIFRAPAYRAHCVIISAIAQLSHEAPHWLYISKFTRLRAVSRWQHGSCTCIRSPYHIIPNPKRNPVLAKRFRVYPTKNTMVEPWLNHGLTVVEPLFLGVWFNHMLNHGKTVWPWSTMVNHHGWPLLTNDHMVEPLPEIRLLLSVPLLSWLTTGIPSRLIVEP